MSEYVVVTNRGSCYSYICKSSPERMAKLCCDAGRWNPGDSPTNGKTYKKICENEHPANSGLTVVTIEDQISGQRYVMGASGLVPVQTKVSRMYSSLDWLNDEEEYYEQNNKHLEIKEENPTEMNDNIKVGDLVIVKKPGDRHDGELMKITHLKAYNYDYVVCYPHQNVAQYGYNKWQVVKYVPEPDLPEDQKPVFSRSELIEILEQSKPAEEILLDIRDHITN